MNYLTIYKDSISDGPGVRVSVYFAGCKPNKCKAGNCPGCHNPEAQKFTVGEEYTEETKNYILGLCRNPYIAGLTICGGEPYDQDEKQLIELLKAFRGQNPTKNV
jgi:anaerobic ribonucleoside-triphosphate reductase activating protein